MNSHHPAALPTSSRAGRLSRRLRGGPSPRYLAAFGGALLLHALVFATAAGWLTRTASSDGVPEAPPSRAIAAFIVGPEDDRFPGLNPVGGAEKEWVPPPDRSARRSSPEFTVDVDKIAARAQVLFPFLTPGLAWEHFGAPPIVDRQLANPLIGRARSRRPSLARRALDADDATLQRLIDRTWSRQDRWRAFAPIRTLAETYGEGGRLPQLLQRYCDQNSLQPYVDGAIRDHRVWSQLSVAAQHVDFIGFVRRYTSDHPGSRTATAVLFLLDSVVQASRDALDALLEGDTVEALAWTRAANPRAYSLATELRRFYERELQRRGLTSAETISVYYDTVRLSILTRIVATSPDGYRVSDARFLIGAIYWRQQRFDEAFAAWGAMSIDPGDSYVQAYSQILARLQSAGTAARANAGRVDPILYGAIRRILKDEQDRWLMFSYDRLRQFGYRFDTFSLVRAPAPD